MLDVGLPDLGNPTSNIQHPTKTPLSNLLKDGVRARARPDHGGLAGEPWQAAGGWRLEACSDLLTSSLQSPVSSFGGDVGGSESHRYREGFGAGLLVKLTLPLTRWAPGSARTVPCRRLYV